MKAYLVLAIGMLLLLASMITAVIAAKSGKQTAIGKGWLRTYILLLLFALTTAVLLSIAGFIERWLSVDAYKTLFDLLTLGLLGVVLSGLVVVVRRRRFLVSYILCLCGAFLTFGEFLGR
jgi:hypothetical protein